MVKTDDYIVLENGSAAAFMDNISSGGVGGAVGKPGGGGAGGGPLLVMGLEECAAVRPAAADCWPSPPLQRSRSVGRKCSADFDESDESVENGYGHHQLMMNGGGGNGVDRAKLTSSTDCAELDDRRMRRQIANCNERRRMQSINAGFQALRQLLPRKDGDKMSKAAILAATAEFIQSLLREKDHLLEESSVAAAKKRRLEVDKLNGTTTSASTEELCSPNLLECLRTIGELRSSLHKETELRMAYEKELLELRGKMRFTPIANKLNSPSGSSEFSPNSSSSSSASSSASSAILSPAEAVAAGGGLLIELARQQQEAQQQQLPALYRPTPILPTDVQLLSSAIASLAKVAPATGATAFGGGLHHQLNGGIGVTPIGIQQQQQQKSLFVVTNSETTTPQATEVQSKAAVAAAMEGGHSHHNCDGGSALSATDATQRATISQQNLQALVLAIRHLEGAGNGAGQSSSAIFSSPSAGSCSAALT